MGALLRADGVSRSHRHHKNGRGQSDSSVGALQGSDEAERQVERRKQVWSDEPVQPGNAVFIRSASENSLRGGGSNSSYQTRLECVARDGLELFVDSKAPAEGYGTDCKSKTA